MHILNDGGIKLFDDDASNPVLPFIKGVDGITSEEVKKQLDMESDLVSSSIKKAISGEVVKSLLINEDAMVMLPNYVIDFTNVKEMYGYQLDGLDSLLNPDGDTWIYIYTKAGGLVKLGCGKSEILDRILTIAVANLFDSKCKVYRDFENGKKLNVVSEKDITTMKLNL